MLAVVLCLQEKKEKYVFPLPLTLLLLQVLKVFVRKTEKLEWQKIVSIDFS